MALTGNTPPLMRHAIASTGDTSAANGYALAIREHCIQATHKTAPGRLVDNAPGYHKYHVAEPPHTTKDQQVGSAQPLEATL